MIRVVVKCVLDRLWQSPKNFLAKRGEVFIDDLFRYLSAALLRSAPRDRRFLGSSFLLGIDSNMMIQLSSDFFMATAM